MEEKSKKATQEGVREAYCSYELSKLLKEKGFDEPTTHWYNVKGSLINDYPVSYENFTNPEKVCLAPTHQMACAWLREVHNMHIDIDPSEGDWHPCVIELETWSAISDGNLKICDSYEEAVEVALKYALENLI